MDSDPPKDSSPSPSTLAVDINEVVSNLQTLVIRLKEEQPSSINLSNMISQANKVKSTVEKNFNEQKPLYPLTKQGTQLSVTPKLIRNASSGRDELSLLALENRNLSELLDDYLQVLQIVMTKHRTEVLKLSTAHLRLIQQLTDQQYCEHADKARADELKRRAALACVEMSEWMTSMERKEDSTKQKTSRLEKENEILRNLLKESFGEEYNANLSNCNSDDSPNATPKKLKETSPT
ncbi:hypothetical protein WR25_19401 [Diploscapter pachys]|uniref:Uncharacterized protein n=1 Tax=Diploscapter pachys TaxID=2018661 RepID=A0A2A2K9B9_9BILA|nr:hypothetical protein WR25_19401 [Diploscapter pachys]